MTTINEQGAVTRRFPVRAFVLTCLVASIWINASEIFRYFVFVMPMTRETLSMVPNVAPMDLGVFAIWGLWDTVLTVMVVWFAWMHRERFGDGLLSGVVVGTMSWVLLFVLFWLAMVNMRLARPATPLIALPLAWFELVVASVLAHACFRRFG